MKLHLVGGFLGSGKTTAIINAAKELMGQGRRVGVITNDQGKYLVDTAFFRLSEVPALEVTGGCFCCNYDDLNGRLAQLVASTHPEVIFAESVGSCADIVATVVKPLLELSQGDFSPSSFSVFTDARLLRRRLLGQEMPFSDDIVYIFDKQIEEAGLLVVNKIDLVDQQALEEVRNLLAVKYRGKSSLFQTSLSPEGVHPWLEQIQSGQLRLPAATLEIDYARYGAGEARLAWYDEEITLQFPEQLPPGQNRVLLKQLIDGIYAGINARGVGIGHLKFIVFDDRAGAKISFPTLAEPVGLENIPEINSSMVSLLVNARVEMPAEDLRDLIGQVIGRSGLGYIIKGVAAFHPPQPRPTHRMV
jgi:Ni2+-binding GTPase involved in maturation of urease and hydrogenase